MAEHFEQPRPSSLWRKLALSLILAVALGSVDHHYTIADRTAPLIGFLILPITAIVDASHAVIEGIRIHTRDIEELGAENARLKRELLNQTYSRQFTRSLEEENRRLRTLAQMDISPDAAKTRVAEVTQINTRAFRQTIRINRGSRHGVTIGQPVLDVNGIVGQTVSVSLFQSMVLLITDVSHALLVRNARTGDRYLAHGNGQGLTLRYVPRHNDLEPGDILVTSGLDDTYPADRHVGEVIEITAHAGRDFLEADIRTIAQLQRNREVLLIWREPAAEELSDVD